MPVMLARGKGDANEVSKAPMRAIGAAIAARVLPRVTAAQKSLDALGVDL